MFAVRRSLVLASFGLLALALSGPADARTDRVPAAAPQGLKAFLLRTDEAPKDEFNRTPFNRTPSFAWLPVNGALRYEFELATSRSFSESSIVWSNADDELAETTTPTAGSGSASAPTGGTGTTAAEKLKALYANLRSPAVSIDVALPWITGSPYALYAHVRALTNEGPTRWSEPFGFNVRWKSIPRDLNSPHPGLVRWSPVEGATAYQVWLFGAKKTFMTTTNVADARDLYDFRRTDPSYTSSISFRVRAQRTLYGEVVSGLPVTTWGPWSPVYTDVQPPLSLGALWNVATVSDVQSDSSSDRAHALTPGFVFGGDRGGLMDYYGGAPAELYRVYVATDRDCVNIVFTGAVIGSPAYAPRITGPLVLPTSSEGIETARTQALETGPEPLVLMIDGTPSVTNETVSAGASTSTGGTATAAAKVDLPDTAWPTGGYYWTVVPVVAEPTGAVAPLPGTDFPVRYRETELPQDVCQSGRVMRFGKATPPVITSSRRPFASGLSPTGRLISAARSTPTFYGTPLVAWESILGAQEYEVQWSRSGNPWRPVGSLKTPATSSLLPLDGRVEPGTWYYRVRGYNHGLLKRPQMAWSAPTALKVAKPIFTVVKKSGR